VFRGDCDRQRLLIGRRSTRTQYRSGTDRLERKSSVVECRVVSGRDCMCIDDASIGYSREERFGGCWTGGWCLRVGVTASTGRATTRATGCCEGYGYGTRLEEASSVHTIHI
jgi:hypothetical protein